MVLARFIVGGLLLAAIACFALSIVTGDRAWRRRGLAIVKWTVAAALAFFAVLIVQRLAAAI